MRHHGAAAVALEGSSEAWSKDNGTGKRDETTDRVHNGGTREIVEIHSQRRNEVTVRSHRCQKSIRTPCPLTDDRIDISGNSHAVEQVADKSSAADHGTGGDRRTRVGKSKLEEPESKKRHAARLISRARALQTQPVHANEAVAMAEHERKTEGKKQNAAQAGVDDALHTHIR